MGVELRRERGLWRYTTICQVSEMRDEKERTYSSPHIQYYAERFKRRRSRSRFGYVFLLFGLAVSAMVILAAFMLISIVSSIVG